jgi:hypothetical protein
MEQNWILAVLKQQQQLAGTFRRSIVSTCLFLSTEQQCSSSPRLDVASSTISPCTTRVTLSEEDASYHPKVLPIMILTVLWEESVVSTSIMVAPAAKL